MRYYFTILLVLPFVCFGQSWFSVSNDLKLPDGYFTVVSIDQDSTVFLGLPNSVLHVGDIINIHDENLIIEANKIKVKYSFYYTYLGDEINVCKDDYCMFFKIIENDIEKIVLNSRHFFTAQFRMSDGSDSIIIQNGITITLNRIR
jgi:hypothetical protein